MAEPYFYHEIPQSRIATFDVYSVGMSKHHVAALLEFDVTDSRIKIRELRKKGHKFSFNAWIIKVVGKTVNQHQLVAAYKCNKKRQIIFKDINISIIVEKEINGERVPIPLVIKNANEKTLREITQEIEAAREQKLSEGDIVLNKKSKPYEKLYYRLPAFLRKLIWKYILSHPKIAYKNMGNVAITSLGMVGQINGWFIHKTIHPLSFGIGSIVKKPLVIKDEIKVREVLNMTILLDHDAVDGASMVRFINDLARNIETGMEL